MRFSCLCYTAAILLSSVPPASASDFGSQCHTGTRTAQPPQGPLCPTWSASRDQAYFEFQIEKRSDVLDDVLEGDEYKRRLTILQASRDVCQPQRQFQHAHVYYGADAVARLTTPMLLRVLLVLRELEDPVFVGTIGALIETDLHDVYNRHVVPSEVGGLVLMDDGKLRMLPVPSMFGAQLYALREQVKGRPTYVDKDPNGYYSMPVWAVRDIPHVFKFHLHATQAIGHLDECAPSFGIGNNTVPYTYDIGHALLDISMIGEAHELLFTKLPGSSFSTYYYGGQLDERGEPFVSVIALPNRSYPAK